LFVCYLRENDEGLGLRERGTWIGEAKHIIGSEKGKERKKYECINIY
jgi:hypothetical protein